MPAPSPDPRLAVAIDHLQAANAEHAQILTDLSAALASLDMTAVQVYGRALSDFGIAELRAMGDLDVPRCLAPAFAEWGNVMIHSSGAGTLFEVGARDGDAQAILLGHESLNESNQAAEAVAESLRTAQLTC